MSKFFTMQHTSSLQSINYLPVFLGGNVYTYTTEVLDGLKFTSTSGASYFLCWIFRKLPSNAINFCSSSQSSNTGNMVGSNASPIICKLPSSIYFFASKYPYSSLSSPFTGLSETVISASMPTSPATPPATAPTGPPAVNPYEAHSRGSTRSLPSS